MDKTELNVVKLKTLSTLLRFRDGAIVNGKMITKPFTMSYFFHECGTPACALGSWAALHPQTWDKYKGPFDPSPYPALIGLDAMLDLQYPTYRDMSKSHFLSVPFEGALRPRVTLSCMIEFGLTPSEAHQLFKVGGCGGAETAEQAADYILEFLEDSEWEQKQNSRSRISV